MAGLSTKAIKTRIKSMQSTRQITKAMELVAASKLRSAQAKAISSRPYFQTLYAAKLPTPTTILPRLICMPTPTASPPTLSLRATGA